MFAGYFNLFLNSRLQTKDGKLILKRKSISKLNDIEKAWISVISGELEILSVTILCLDKTIPPN